MSSEHEADGASAPPPELIELKSAATGADGASSSSAPPGASTPPLDPLEAEAREWAMVPRTMGAIICRALPEVRDDWSEQNALEWGRAFAPIAKSKGWTVGEFMAWLGPWVGVAIASERMLTPTIQAGHKRIKAARAAAANAEKPAEVKAPAAAPA